MPSKTPAQRSLFGAALAIKRGKAKASGKAGQIARKMSENKIADFARKGAVDRALGRRKG